MIAFWKKPRIVFRVRLVLDPLELLYLIFALYFFFFFLQLMDNLYT
jgi:hypothetical protein